MEHCRSFDVRQAIVQAKVMFRRDLSRNPLRHRLIARLSACTAIIAMFVAAGCSSDSPAVTTPAPAFEGTISGQLIVPPNQLLEVEPNETLDQAQDVGQVTRLAGAAAAEDAGFPLPGVNAEAQDLYRLTATVPVRVTLTIGANELFTYDAASQTIIEVINDLDLARSQLTGP